MNYLGKILKYITHPRKVVLFLNAHGFHRAIPDKFLLQCLYRDRIGKKLNLYDPKTYNEKLQWLKLYDRRPEYTQMVDKYDAKQYVADRIGQAYIVSTFGVWDRPEDIDFDALPNQFVLKCTHDSGGVVICNDKSALNREQARQTLEACLKREYFWSGREWPYKNIKPRIIAEQYLEDSKTSELRDYKFFCFDGCVKALFVASDRQNPDEETKFDFFDEEYRHLSFTNGHPNADVAPDKPVCFEEMKALAAKLSSGIPHVRVDFYEVDGKVYFGEMTFFHWSGIVPFEPEAWDRTFGDWIRLPNL